MANGGGNAGGGLPAAGAAAGAFPANAVNCANAPCKPGQQPAAPLPSVAPVLTGPLLVVVKKNHTNPARVAILLKTDSAFTGNGTFTAAPADNLQFFTTKKGAVAIKFDGKQNVFSGPALTKGVTLFAAGAIASAAFNDVVLTLRLDGGPNPLVNNPAKRKMTAIDVSLQICKPRTATGADPPTLSETDKINPGRALHVQNAASTHLRPMLIVGPVKPAAFAGQLQLNTDFSSKGSVVLFPNEKQTATETPSNSMDLPVAGKKVFVEGIGVSDHMRDIKVRLAIKGLEDDADHVMLTVIEAKLDVCASRQHVDKPPTPLPDGDKTMLGRSIAFHSADPRSRAMIILRHVKPLSFVGKLLLTPLATGTGRARVFENETGGAAIAALNTPGTPMEIAHDKSFSAGGLHRFVEGSAVSSALDDVAFELGVKDVEDNCDQVNLTVINVASLQGSLDSTKNAASGVRPAADNFTTNNAALAFAAPPADLMVVILNAGPITVQALNIQPVVAKNQLHWVIEQDPSDTVAKGLPTLDKDTGDQIKITPNTPGTFRLICYCGSNKKPFTNEEVRVLRMVIVKITPQLGGWVKVNNNHDPANPAQNAFLPGVDRVDTNDAPPAMSLQVDFLLEGGGNDRKFGLDKVHLINVGNVTSDDFIVNYAGAAPPGDIRPGRESEDADFNTDQTPGFPSPMVDTGNVAQGNEPAGGNSLHSPKRRNSNEAVLGNGPGGKGQLKRVTSKDFPNFSWDDSHPKTNNPWTSTQGANAFTEWILAFTDTFPKNYVALGKGGYTVTVIGTRGVGGRWADAGSSVTPTAWSTGGFPKTADDAHAQVVGRSFVREVGSIITP